jgi:hypothetical protein
MQKAIEIRTRGICRKCNEPLGGAMPYFLLGNLIGQWCDDCCWKLMKEQMKAPAIIHHRDTKTSDSPDTDYKIALTAWIERKKWFDAMERYTFESGSFKGVPWMNCKIDIDHEEGEG